MLPCEEMGYEIGLSTTLNNEEIRLEKSHGVKPAIKAREGYSKRLAGRASRGRLSERLTELRNAD
jgi:hypothetical protein